MALNWEKSQIIANATAISGSIRKVSNAAGGVIDSISFGEYSTTPSLSEIHQTYTTDITLANSGGGEIDGPIASIKLTSGAVIIHYNGELSL